MVVGWLLLGWGLQGGRVSRIQGGCVQANADTTQKQIRKGLGCV